MTNDQQVLILDSIIRGKTPLEAAQKQGLTLDEVDAFCQRDYRFREAWRIAVNYAKDN